MDTISVISVNGAGRNKKRWKQCRTKFPKKRERQNFGYQSFIEQAKYYPFKLKTKKQIKDRKTKSFILIFTPCTFPFPGKGNTLAASMLAIFQSFIRYYLSGARTAVAGRARAHAHWRETHYEKRVSRITRELGQFHFAWIFFSSFPLHFRRGKRKWAKKNQQQQIKWKITRNQIVVYHDIRIASSNSN